MSDLKTDARATKLKKELNDAEAEMIGAAKEFGVAEYNYRYISGNVVELARISGEAESKMITAARQYGFCERTYYNHIG